MNLINIFTQFGILIVLFGFMYTVFLTTWHHWEESIIHPLILANCIITYFVIAPAAYFWLTGDGPFPAQSLLSALLVEFVAYLAALVVFYRFESTRLNKALWGARPPVNNTYLFWIGVCGFVLGLSFYLFYVLINGGFFRLLTVTPRTAFQTVPDTGRYRILARIGTFGGLITALTAVQPRVKARRLTRLQQLLVLGMSGTVVAMAVSYRARYLILIPAAYLLAYCYTTQRINRRQVIGWGAGVIFVGVSFSFVEHSLIGQAGIRMFFRDIIHLPRFKAFVMIVDAVPNRYPRQYGLTFITPFLMGMETEILRYGDHVDIIVFGRDRPFITLSGMFIGEWYLNFGVAGAIAGGAVYGGLLKLVYQLQRSSSNLIQGAYPMFLVGSSLLIASNINWVTKTIFLPIIPPLIAAVVAALLCERFVEIRAEKQLI